MPDLCDKNPQRACAECPFNREITPGTLGGSPVETYVGQIVGPFWLPCHLHSDFDDPAWKDDLTKPQCAGAAIFRANLGIEQAMPAGLHRLPAGSDPHVFVSLQDFVAHHLQIPMIDAVEWVVTHPPRLLHLAEQLRAALRRSGTRRG